MAVKVRIKKFTKAVLTGVTALVTGRVFGAEMRLKKFLWSAPSGIIQRSPITVNNLLFMNVTEMALPRETAEKPDSETIRCSPQTVGDVEIRGTWTKSILDGSGNPVFQTGEIFENLPPELTGRAEMALAREPLMLEIIRSRGDILPAHGYLGKPRLELVHAAEGGFRLEWILAYFNDPETEVKEARFNEQGQLLAAHESGYHLADAMAKIFPRGPRLSPLGEVKLEKLDDSGGLRSDRLETLSGLVTQAVSPDHRFEYSPDDPRFDQVQAYYYADQILNWFQTKFAYEAAGQLEVKVQVGTNSNAAYYYGNRVRIGAGDGVKYSHMARDPSIVIHEVTHSVIDAYSRLPPDGEGGGLNESFADFFTASFLNNPNMGEVASVGEPFTRTLKNTMQAAEGLSGGVYTASRFIGGTFWDLRELLGKDTAENLAFRTLVRLGPGSRYTDFVPTLRLAAEGVVSEAELPQIKKVLETRNWTLDAWKD